MSKTVLVIVCLSATFLVRVLFADAAAASLDLDSNKSSEEEIMGLSHPDEGKGHQLNSRVIRSDDDFVPSLWGCKEGYCWSHCNGFFHQGAIEWCWTTRSYSQSYRYVKCSTFNDCSGEWKCAGPCSI